MRETGEELLGTGVAEKAMDWVTFLDDKTARRKERRA